MKKILVSLLASSVLLSACSNDAEDAQKTEVKQEKSMTTETIINDSIDQNNDVLSYEEHGTLSIDDNEALEFFVTMDNDENVKFEVDNNESVYTFYDVDSEKKEVQNGKLEDTDTELNALNYIEIIESLKDLPEGELTTEDDLYVLTYNVLEVEDLSAISNNLSSYLEEYDTEELSLILKFNSDYQLVEAHVDGVFSEDDESYNVQGDVNFNDINNIDTIDMPNRE
ncbi:hypothetical protein [Nosocomiicoccus ampullae]|uniref:PBP1b-binding outer membrane lipoprotein LpoB n=1 Tax=Nosocomiicoccus ampullae TaxID=489910 RepID=A0A9Q2CXL1_9STAP|nr:hypothetical protein [Nosocomiicoccus ampullae]MBB5175291.1 PBP1b-binding outer membrane lipoprotein LpoB [Nosocomiicoccus ampullae]QYA46334.1 hypothetical protein KPF49_04860 [Nosocomiicoccus ampullae]